MIDPQDGCQKCDCYSPDEPAVFSNDDDIITSRCECQCHYGPYYDLLLDIEVSDKLGK